MVAARVYTGSVGLAGMVLEGEFRVLGAGARGAICFGCVWTLVGTAVLGRGTDILGHMVGHAIRGTALVWLEPHLWKWMVPMSCSS